jgi:hypothetical protein
MRSAYTAPPHGLRQPMRMGCGSPCGWGVMACGPWGVSNGASVIGALPAPMPCMRARGPAFVPACCMRAAPRLSLFEVPLPFCLLRAACCTSPLPRSPHVCRTSRPRCAETKVRVCWGTQERDPPNPGAGPQGPGVARRERGPVRTAQGRRAGHCPRVLHHSAALCLCTSGPLLPPPCPQMLIFYFFERKPKHEIILMRMEGNTSKNHGTPRHNDRMETHGS